MTNGSNERRKSRNLQQCNLWVAINFRAECLFDLLKYSLFFLLLHACLSFFRIDGMLKRPRLFFYSNLFTAKAIPSILMKTTRRHAY